MELINKCPDCHISEDNMSDLYQALIDRIYKTPAKHDNFTDCAYLLACAIKECMTHKDDAYGFIGTGYLYEKIGKALNRVGMDYCMYQYTPTKTKYKIIEEVANDLGSETILRALKREVKASA